MDEENQYDYIEWPEEEHFPPRHRNSSCSVKEKNREPVLLYQPERHMSKAFAVMEDMRRTNKLCDVVIKVGSLSLNAHRVILASSSPYFDAMFSGKNVESQGGVVNIKEFNPDAIQNLVDFFYTSSLTINSSNVQELLPAAGLLQLDGVVGACCDFLASQLHPSNCLGIRLFSSTHTCSSLWRQCNMFMQQRFPEIVLHEEFLDLGFDELYKVVSDSSLNVRGEEQVYEAVLSWVRHRLDERKCHVSDLLKCVRMPLMSATYLSREVRKEPLLMECFDGRGLLIDAMDFHLRKHYARDNTSQDKKISTTPRRCPGLEFLFAVGGAGPPVLENDPYLDLCECLDVEKNEWRTVAPMSMRRSGLRVASVGGYLFAVGGFSALDTKALDVVDRYDPMTDSWRLVAPMNSARRSFAVAVLNGYLYAMGGINGGTYYDSVERYCPRSNKWVFIQRMSVERRAVCAAGLDNHIYAAGGHDGDGLLDTVERYDPDRDTWTNLTTLSFPCCLGSLVALKGCLYAIGGYDGASVLQCLQRYDPKTHEWSDMAPLPIQRSGFGSAVVDSTLYLVGGCNKLSRVASVDRYNPEQNNWTSASSMSIRRSGIGVGVAPAFLF